MTDSTMPGAGVRAIVLYKTAKAGLQLAAALVLGALWPLGLPETMGDWAIALRHHVTHAWALGLAAVIERGATDRGVGLSILALGLDGTLTAIEAWALRSARWWGPWLVVLATGSLLPFEVYEFVKTPRPSRAILISLNLGIVAYLARRARREHPVDARRLPEE
jgi:uncharacterized membrane protein (DUF2068 family)